MSKKEKYHFGFWWPPAKKQKIENLTDYAEVYGYPPWADPGNVDEHLLLGETRPRKSGLSPVDFKPSHTEEELRRLLALEGYQRKTLEGFTIKELTTLETFAPTCENVQYQSGPPYSIRVNPIHSVFARERWMAALPRHLAPFTLGLGRPGYWDVDMESNAAITKSGYWDTLRFGKYDKIQPADLPLGFAAADLYRCQGRAAHETNSEEAIKSHQALWRSMAHKVNFRLKSSFVEPDTGLVSNKIVYACTEGPAGLSVWLSYELLEPLMNPNLCIGDRLIQQSQIAITLLHELAHVAWHTIGQAVGHPGPEPYFEDQSLSELGWAMEEVITKLTSSKQKFNHSWAQSLLPTPGLKTRPEDWFENEFWPIPIEYVEKISDPH
ncbi:hypothetical protein G7Y89_g14816 [Cudoniella acicularis]|uniref:Uncharacterized protein n=1 Tax=Cudoniella acicularis TaxID=354080 RepID=A0A8H4QYJ3_9HELO|nr:hypothetical protein G7Y89_g14816 [Cudoniella acicularis]